MRQAAVALSMARMMYGGVALLFPRYVLGLYDNRVHVAPDELVVRALGGRHVLQGAVTLACPRSAVLRWGAAVDAAHSASMALLSWRNDDRRSAAGRNALAAGLFAAAGALAARRTPARRAEWQIIRPH